MHRAVALSIILCAAGCSNLPAVPSPYAGQERRDIKSLSASDVNGLLAGDGMGYAKSAELNGYPGPAHVRELANELGLSPDQLAATAAVFERMNQSAKRLGTQIVDAERRLEQAFASHAIDAGSLSSALNEIAVLQGRLRNVHLQAHLEQTAILSRDQVASYIGMRGYDSGSSDHGKDRHKH